MPQDPATITLGLASSIRVASSCAAKPPNTTEWMAPIRAQAEHGDGRFRYHRHVDDDPIALGHAERQQGPGEAGDLIAQLRDR